MDVSELKDIFQVPSFAKQEAYDFDDDGKSAKIYRELNEIGEEIEKCRLRNC